MNRGGSLLLPPFPSADGIAFSSGRRCHEVTDEVSPSADGEKPPSGREVPRYEAVGARRAYQTRNTFRLRTNKGFPENPLEREAVNFFLCQKEKSLQKRSWQPCRLIAYAPINCPVRSFSASKGAVPQMAALPTSEAKRLEAVGSRTGGFDLMGAVLARPRHTNLTVRGNRVRMDAWVRRRGFTAPTWGFFPAVCG